MKALALLPLLIASFLLFMRPPEKVFILVVIPMLLAIPTYYYFPVPGLPDLNFFHFASIPVFVWWLKRGWKEYRIYIMDYLVFIYVLIAVLSEFATMGTKDGINIIIDRTVQIIIPFLLTKHFFANQNLRISILKIMVVIGAILAFFSPLEFKFDLAVVDVLQWVWPEYLRWPGWVRYGYVRTAAVYGHPIIAGMMWSFFTLFGIWLLKQNAWKKKWHGQLAVLLNAGGVAMAISRGPMLGLFAGLVLLTAGWSKNRTAMFMFLFLCSLIILPPAAAKFIDYASVDRFSSMSETQENVAYRKELLDNYIEEIKKRPWLGYGRNGMPVVKGQHSIDNQYVYIALMHGIVEMGVFLIMTSLTFIKMISYGLRHTPDDKTAQLSWLLAACVGTWFVTLATVWMGAQSEQMVFILLAMASTLGNEKGDDVVRCEEDIVRGWVFRAV